MKRISRPPDAMSEEARWEQTIMELLNCYHYRDDVTNLPLKYLSHQHGESISSVLQRVFGLRRK